MKNPWQGINRNVFILGLVSFLTDVSSEMICPLLPVFLTSTLGASTLFLGTIEGIAESTSSLLKFFSGWFSDRIKKRKIIILLGYTLSSVSRPLVGLATLPGQVLATRFFDRAGKGLRTPPRDALIADSTPKENWGKAFSFHRAMDHFGAVVGPLIATLILSYFIGDYRLVFLLAGVPGIIAVLLIIFYVKELGPPPSTAGAQSSSPFFSLKGFEGDFKKYLGIMIVFTLGNSSDAFLILRAQSLGIPVYQLPLIWVVLHISKMFSSVPGGVLSDRIGRKKVIVAGWIIYAFTYLGFAVASQAYHIWGLFFIYGLFFGLTEGTERAFVADLVPPEKRGTAYGMFNAMIGIAALPASVIMGLIWKEVGIFYAFSFGAFMALFAGLLLFALIPAEDRKTVL